MNRFDNVAYDELAKELQANFKTVFSAAAQAVEELGPNRPTSLALTSLEEAYMWVGKAIRDNQIERNGTTDLGEGRSNS
jgi:hypothetical protein